MNGVPCASMPTSSIGRLAGLPSSLRTIAGFLVLRGGLRRGCVGKLPQVRYRRA